MARTSIIAAAVAATALSACAGKLSTARIDDSETGEDAQVSDPSTDADAIDEPTDTPNDPPNTETMDAPTVTVEGFSDVPGFDTPVRYNARPGGVTIQLPQVAEAGDYRVYALTSDVKVTQLSDGSEHVEGATIACAGLVQNNQCDPSEAITNYGSTFFVPNCSRDVRAIPVQKKVLRQVGLDGLSGKTRIVVEAIDSLCPFPGAYGSARHEIKCIYDGMLTGKATYQGTSVTWPKGPASFPIRTEADIRAEYGSLILNGQKPPPVVQGQSPWASVGLPAPKHDPKVLRRSIIEVEPLDPTTLPAGFTTSDFYESFSDPNDQPKRTNDTGLVGPAMEVQVPTLFQTSKLNLYSYATDGPQFFVAQGTLRSILADIGQGIMGSNVMYPKRAFQMPATDDRFIHTTFEAVPNATQRRYWWFHACGAAMPGKTIVNGKLAPGAGIVASPSFMNPIEGSSVSSAGWNCINIVPRGGNYEVMPGGPYTNNTLKAGRPETDLRIIINKPVPDAKTKQQLLNTVVNVSPAQGGGDAEIDGSWMRQWDENKKLVGVMLDDQMFVEQRVKFDVYFNRGRIVVYANGVQKVCNDFPNLRLTMAEAAVGVGHVFYHSSAERFEFMREDWIRTGQYQYLHNLPFVDPRNFDNFGVREGASLPSNFQAGQCYSAK